jgi:hypothetical protein
MTSSEWCLPERIPAVVNDKADTSNSTCWLRTKFSRSQSCCCLKWRERASFSHHSAVKTIKLDRDIVLAGMIWVVIWSDFSIFHCYIRFILWIHEVYTNFVRSAERLSLWVIFQCSVIWDDSNFKLPTMRVKARTADHNEWNASQNVDFFTHKSERHGIWKFSYSYRSKVMDDFVISGSSHNSRVRPEMIDQYSHHSNFQFSSSFHKWSPIHSQTLTDMGPENSHIVLRSWMTSWFLDLPIIPESVLKWLTNTVII